MTMKYILLITCMLFSLNTMCQVTIMRIHKKDGSTKEFSLNEIDSITYATANLATVTTRTVGNIQRTSAIGGGSILNNGGAQVREYGICWSTNSAPTIENNKSITDSNTNTFSINITNLKPGTTYYVRAFAINAAGTAYGNEVSFKTSATGAQFNESLFYSSLSDIDGNVYKTILIGGREWMAEDLRVTKYQNGQSINHITTDTLQWMQTKSGAWSYYNNDTSRNIPYGKLYNWYTTADSRKVCPTGWRIPTEGDWNQLINTLDSTFIQDEIIQSSKAGAKMKSTSTIYWSAYDQNTTNSSGFSAIESRYRDFNGSFNGISETYWWSSNEFNTSHALSRNIFSSNGNVKRLNLNKNTGLAVRCIKE